MSAEADRELPLRQLAGLPLHGAEVPKPSAEREAAALEDRAAIAEIKSDLASIHTVRIGRYVKRTALGEVLEWGAGPQRRVILTPDLRLIGIGIMTGTYRGVHGVTIETGDLSSRVNGG